MANPRPIQKLFPQEPFHQKNSVKSGTHGALVGGCAGFAASAVQNSLARTNVGAWGVFTRSGSTVVTFSMFPRRPRGLDWGPSSAN